MPKNREQFEKAAKLAIHSISKWNGHHYDHFQDQYAWQMWQAAYSLGWDTMKEQAAQVSDKFRGQLSREEWPPFGLCQEEGRFDSGVSGLTATRIAEAIRAIPREEKP